MSLHRKRISIYLTRKLRDRGITKKIEQIVPRMDAIYNKTSELRLEFEKDAFDKVKEFYDLRDSLSMRDLYWLYYYGSNPMNGEYELPHITSCGFSAIIVPLLLGRIFGKNGIRSRIKLRYNNIISELRDRSIKNAIYIVTVRGHVHMPDPFRVFDHVFVIWKHKETHAMVIQSYINEYCIVGRELNINQICDYLMFDLRTPKLWKEMAWVDISEYYSHAITPRCISTFRRILL